VRKAMKVAELIAGVEVEDVYVGISGEHIDASISAGVVAVGGGEISAADVRRVHEVARAVVVPPDRELLHALTQEYIVDHQAGIRDPIGMAGARLEAEGYIITSDASAGQNVRKAVSRSGYRISAMGDEPLAAAMVVLTEDEKEVGSALVDLGAASTEFAVFRDGKTRHLATVPWGGIAVTNDLVKGPSIPFAEAERAKEQYGVAFTQLVDPRETVELPGPAPGSTRQVARELIAHIIEQRVDEILGLVAREIEQAGIEPARLGAGIVLTGGGASLPGTIEVAQHVFGAPARIGTPGAGMTGLVEGIRRPRFATAAGLVLFAAAQQLESGGPSFGETAVGRLVAWLKEFF